ncbi:hypothetical protein Tco_0409389 [Tanacetum coccineum]
MAVIILKEAQGPWMAGIKTLESLTEEKHFARLKSQGLWCSLAPIKDPRKDSECNDQEKEDNIHITNNVNAASINEINAVGGKTSIELPFDLNMSAFGDKSMFDRHKRID